MKRTIKRQNNKTSIPRFKIKKAIREVNAIFKKYDVLFKLFEGTKVAVGVEDDGYVRFCTPKRDCIFNIVENEKVELYGNGHVYLLPKDNEDLKKEVFKQLKVRK